MSSSPHQKQLIVILDTQLILHGGLDLEQAPAIGDEVVDGSIMLEETDALHVQGDWIARGQDNPRMNANLIAGPALTKETRPSVIIRSGLTGIFISAAR